MKTLLLFLLNISVVTAAPHAMSATDECKLQHLLLAEIIDHVNNIKRMHVKSSEFLVEKVMTPENCTFKSFCKAGAVLSEYKAEKLGLHEKDWLLPRHLVAYSRKTHCDSVSSADQVQFLQVLESIKLCAQKEFIKPCERNEVYTE